MPKFWPRPCPPSAKNTPTQEFFTSIMTSCRLLHAPNRETTRGKERSMCSNKPRRNGSSVNTTPRRSHMSEKTWKRNTTGMTAHANLRKEQKRKGVDDAIAALLREQK